MLTAQLYQQKSIRIQNYLWIMKHWLLMLPSGNLIGHQHMAGEVVPDCVKRGLLCHFCDVNEDKKKHGQWTSRLKSRCKNNLKSILALLVKFSSSWNLKPCFFEPEQSMKWKGERRDKFRRMKMTEKPNKWNLSPQARMPFLGWHWENKC